MLFQWTHPRSSHDWPSRRVCPDRSGDGSSLIWVQRLGIYANSSDSFERPGRLPSGIVFLPRPPFFADPNVKRGSYSYVPPYTYFLT